MMAAVTPLAAFPGTADDALVQRVVAAEQPRILRLAQAALALPPPTITTHPATNSAGGIHDFYSEADYSWPDFGAPHRAPYILRDGLVNPHTFPWHRRALLDMKSGVAAFAAAYALSGDDRYPARAAEWLRVFFLDAATRMNPSLPYAQAVPGASTGNPYGIIDTLSLAELPTAITFLDRSPAFPPAVEAGLQQWFGQYSAWLTNSPAGHAEMSNPNNHSVALCVQLTAYARFTGDTGLVARVRQQYHEQLLVQQMKADGSFPHEINRSRSYHYSLFQLDNLAELCALLTEPGQDEWNFTLPDGRGFRRALDFMYAYLLDKDRWLAAGHPRDNFHWETRPMREPALLFATAIYGDDKYFQLWLQEDESRNDSASIESRRSQGITQPILWVARPEAVPLVKAAR